MIRTNHVVTTKELAIRRVWCVIDNDFGIGKTVAEIVSISKLSADTVREALKSPLFEKSGRQWRIK